MVTVIYQLLQDEYGMRQISIMPVVIEVPSGYCIPMMV